MKSRKSSGSGSSMDTGLVPGRAEGTLGKEVQVSIGSQLRKQYQKIVEEGVPDRFLDLLQRYEKKIQDRAPDGSPASDNSGSKDPTS